MELEHGKSEAVFALFPQLLPELRFKIWGHACSVTRDIDIRLSHLDFGMRNELCERPYYWRSILGAKISPVLHASKESRSEGLKHYTLDFGSEMIPVPGWEVPFSVTVEPRIYFNWSCDRLCLPDPLTLWDYQFENISGARPYSDFLERCLERKLRYLAINTYDYWEPQHWHDEEDRRAHSFLEFIPLTANFHEVLLFEDSHMGITSLYVGFVDLLPAEKGLKMQEDERVVKKKMSEAWKKDGAMSSTATLIRTSKVIVQRRGSRMRTRYG
ncbi:hypothetical protein L207DRAFT_536944 [Hyaloscypha variabilis F]|uniref:2EXR domain-containing protein n=1 Tax=Hyaloscypha variabilis (strain UAMH 11265 / GT02V1 / F) TaxID=1149755 RepID=A0A2J6QYW9_HYAVF|nr:hypothetical protein L207DRAFT_536944 [Hyaloscypha variabilis F]